MLTPVPPSKTPARRDVAAPALPRRRLPLRGGRILEFTVLGFGGAPIGNMHRAMSDADAEATLEAALDAGVRYVDTAPLYGHGLSERRVGRGLVRGPADAILSTKVGRLLEPAAAGSATRDIYVPDAPARIRFDYTYDGVMRSYEASLVRLGRRQVDVLYVHDIEASAHGSEALADARMRELLDGGGWRALDELRSAGAVSAIGAGVNSIAPCRRLLADADPDLFLLAGRYSLLDQSAADQLLPDCAARGVGVVIGGAFNSGILATGPRPGAWFDYAPAPPDILARAAEIEAICQRHATPLAQAALQFPLSHPAVVCVVAGARTAEEAARNVRALAAPVPAGLWADLTAAGLLSAAAPAPCADASAC